ncbi:MAG TPA: ABC transporter permease [Thermoplasmata archaeon]|nr:ABC transporter permease [Thermoplasmata archaeon]
MRAGLRRTLAVTRKTLSQFRHDRRTLGFIVAMPLLMVVVFGYTFGGEVHNVRTLVVNSDAGPMASRLLENITGDTLALESSNASPRNCLAPGIGIFEANVCAAREEVFAGRAWAVLAFPENFSANLPPGNATITVVLDGSSPPIRAAVLGTLRGALEKTFAGAGAPFALELDYVYGSEDTRFIDSFAPGVVALAVLMVTTIFSVIMVVREKSGGILERLFATPLRSTELVVGLALALAVIAFAQSIVVMGAALLLFQVKVVGSIPLAFGILLLFGIGNQGLGIMLSSAAKNELQAIQFVPLILFPSLLLTGVFFPLEAIPSSFRPFSYVVPLTYASDALHSIMLRGWGVVEVGVDIVALLVYDALTLLGAAFFVRRQA